MGKHSLFIQTILSNSHCQNVVSVKNVDVHASTQRVDIVSNIHHYDSITPVNMREQQSTNKRCLPFSKEEKFHGWKEKSDLIILLISRNGGQTDQKKGLRLESAVLSWHQMRCIFRNYLNYCLVKITPTGAMDWQENHTNTSIRNLRIRLGNGITTPANYVGLLRRCSDILCQSTISTSTKKMLGKKTLTHYARAATLR